MSTTRVLGIALAGVVAFAALYLLGAWMRWYGSYEGAGEPTAIRVPAEVVAARQRSQQRASASLSSAPTSLTTPAAW